MDGRSLLVLPAVILLTAFWIFPVLTIVGRSLAADGRLFGWTEGLTLDNFTTAFGSRAYQAVMARTLQIAVVSTLLTVVVAYPFAYFMARCGPRARTILLLAVLLPALTSSLVRLYALTYILTPLGLMRTTAGSIIGMVSWLLPFMVLILYGSMRSFDWELVRAARTLGATPFYAAVHVFHPLTRAGFYGGLAFILTLSFGFYLTPAILGGRADVTIAMYVADQVTINRWGVASALGVILLVFSLVWFGYIDRAMAIDRSVISVDRGLSQPPDELRGLAKLAMAGIAASVAVMQLGPLVVAVIQSFSAEIYSATIVPSAFSFRWYNDLISDRAWTSAALRSVQVAALTALVVVPIAAAAAFALLSPRMRYRKILRIAFLMPVVIPSVLHGAGLIYVEASWRLTGTLVGLVAAHAVVALPYALTVMLAALSSMNPHLVEAARTLGASATSSFMRIVVPLILPSVLAAALLVLMVSWDEIVVSMFIVGFERTLPIQFFRYLQSIFTPTLAAASTVLLAIGIVLGLALHLANRSRQRVMS